MRSKTGKDRDFGAHFGANLACKPVRFGPFAECSTFIFNKMVASSVSNKQSFFPFSCLPFRQAFRFPLMRCLVRAPGSE
jgi:hypothetical protein